VDRVDQPMATSQQSRSPKKQSSKKGGGRKGAPQQPAAPWWPPLLLIFVAVFALNGNTLNHDYALDDDVVYLQNRHVQRGVEGIPDIVSHSFIHGHNGHNDQSYRPVVLVLFALEFEQFGNDPFVGHFLNVLWYGVAGWLLYLVLLRFFPRWPRYLPLLMTLIFLAHPVHTEVVANIKGRDEIVNFIFLFLAVLLLLEHVRSQKTWQLVVSGLSFCLALLSKESSVTFLAVIPLILYFFTPVTWKRMPLLMVPYVLAFGVYWGLRSHFLDNVTFGEEMTVLNNALVAASGPGEKLASAILIMGIYVKLLFFPHPLSFDYSYNQIPIVSFGDPKALLALALFAGLGFVALRGWKRKDPLAFAILYFFITMSVVSNIFIEIGATLAERFLFAPSLAFAIGAVVLPARLLGLEKGQLKPAKMYLAAAPLLAFFAYKTIDRNVDWASNEALFFSALEATPNSTRAQMAVGSVYLIRAESTRNQAEQVRNYQQSLAYFQRSVEILPSNFEGWYNLGVASQALGQEQQAMTAYQNALSYSPSDPN
ncbi:MAG: tetratricopeptide repeat protein, partial [Bacteroidota bacterium]